MKGKKKDMKISKEDIKAYNSMSSINHHGYKSKKMNIFKNDYSGSGIK